MTNCSFTQMRSKHERITDDMRQYTYLSHLSDHPNSLIAIGYAANCYAIAKFLTPLPPESIINLKIGDECPGRHVVGPEYSYES